MKMSVSHFCVIKICFIISFMYGQMIGPEDGATLNYTHVLFEWAQIPDASEYQIEISSNSSFSSILSTAVTSSLVYLEDESLDWDGDYYWRVRPILDES